MFKKKALAVVCILTVTALGVLAWLYGYHNQKSNDNLPALSMIAEMEEADVNELLAGYHRTQLRTVWEEPAFTNTNSDIWEIDGKTTLEVSYNNRKKAVVCRLTKGDRISELQTASVSVTEAEGGDTFDLAEEVAETISQILDAGSWVPDATNCASDYVLTFDGRTIYYHSDCGTFNERLEQSNQSLRLSDADRETVNRIIQAVIPCDLSPNVPTEISYTDIWPVNTFTDDLPVPPGTVSWAAFDEEHQSLAVNLTDMSETDYADYMKSLQQAGFSVTEGTSEDIEGQDYTSTGVLMSNGEKNLSISYISGDFTIYISFME